MTIIISGDTGVPVSPVTGTLAVANGDLMGLMVEAIKELRTEIRVIQSQIKLINNKKDIP